MGKRIIKLLKGITLFNFIFFIYVVSIAIYSNVKTTAKTETYTANEFWKTYFTLQNEMDNTEYVQLDFETSRELVHELVPIKFYIETTREMKCTRLGCTVMPFRIIAINKNLAEKAKTDSERLPKYITTLTHEYLHLHLLDAYEKNIEYQTFLVLYNSNNNYLRYVAMQFALNILSGGNLAEYDCTDLIIDYFRDKGV